jgi:Uma2 family endonuclease
MATTTQHWRFSVADFHKMAAAGILGEEDRAELIDGEVRPMTPIGPLHSGLEIRLTTLLTDRLGKAALVSVQNPVRLSDYSEPQPDIVVLRPRSDFYQSSHPTPADVLLLIEVCDTSVDYDQVEKLPRYAAAGVPEVWIVNCQEDCVRQFAQPGPSAYGLQRAWRRGERIATSAVPGLQVTVDDVLGPG